LNLKCNIINRAFNSEDIDKLKKALLSDDIIIPSLIKILRLRALETCPKESDLDKPNYEFRRAFLDGRAYENNFTIQLLEKGDN